MVPRVVAEAEAAVAVHLPAREAAGSVQLLANVPAPDAEAEVVVPLAAREDEENVQLPASGLVPDAVPARMVIRH